MITLALTVNRRGDSHAIVTTAVHQPDGNVHALRTSMPIRPIEWARELDRFAYVDRVIIRTR